MTKKKYNVQFSRRAEYDIEAIYSYFNYELKNRSAFAAWYGKLKNACANVSLFPRSCPETSLEFPFEARKLLIDNYIALYTVDDVEKTVTILTIKYARRDLTRLV